MIRMIVGSDVCYEEASLIMDKYKVLYYVGGFVDEFRWNNLEGLNREELDDIYETIKRGD